MKYNKKNSKSKNKKPKRKTRSFSKVKKSRMNRINRHTKKNYQMVPIYGGFDDLLIINFMLHESKITQYEFNKLFQLSNQGKLTDMKSINEALQEMRNKKTTNVNKNKSLPQESSTRLNDEGIQEKEDNKPSKTTLVKLLLLPDTSKHFRKGELPKKNNLEIGEHMVIVKDVYIDQYGKIVSDLKSVDTGLGNLLDGCVGPGCKDGQVRPTVLLSKEIEVNYNNKDSRDKLLAEKNRLENMR
jgi:hypothetical protein